MKREGSFLDKFFALVIGLGLIVLFGFLLGYAEIGYVHQAVASEVSIHKTATEHVYRIRRYHHGREGEVVVGVVLAFCWMVLSGLGVAFITWGWKGYPE